jgi:putative hydrolase of the HAD superfamily
MNVVFDFGGVLFRWQPHEFMPRLLPHHASSEAATSEFVANFFQGYSGDWGDFDRGVADEARVAQRISWRLGIDIADVKTISRTSRRFSTRSRRSSCCCRMPSR